MIAQIEARGLVKMFGSTCALAGVDARFSAGQVTVIEGPNGSGKSSLLGILSLLAKPTEGALKFGKLDALRSASTIRKQLGYLGHASMLYPDLSGRENLKFFAQLHSVTLTDEATQTLMTRFGIGAFVDRPVRTYSRGQRQRVALARALLHQPSVLMLDEPATGLDDASTDRLVEVVKEERDKDAIVIVVTHDDRMADRIADVRLKLARGRVIA